MRDLEVDDPGPYASKRRQDPMRLLESKRLYGAYHMAQLAHEGQMRRYTQEPYIVHPLSVAMRLSAYTEDEDLLAAAFLHDVDEDTVLNIADIQAGFGIRVAQIVEGLTNISVPEDGNRQKRKAIEREHIARGCEGVQTIKVFDIIDNIVSVVDHDPVFAKLYLEEKRRMLEVIKKPSRHIIDLGWEHWNRAMRTLLENSRRIA